MTAAAMAATPDPLQQRPLQQRYEAIERVYSERRWDDVARRSEELLLELPNDPGHPLRQRVQLLLGHTYLYGYEDAATASGFYSRVQAATKESVLLEIAAQGLEQCARLAPATPPVAAEPANARPAMPWMEQLGGVDPAAPSTLPELSVERPELTELTVEVIDEPELIEVAQADPATAQELDIAVNAESPALAPEPNNGLSPEEMAELSKGLLRVVIR